MFLKILKATVCLTLIVACNNRSASFVSLEPTTGVDEPEPTNTLRIDRSHPGGTDIFDDGILDDVGLTEDNTIATLNRVYTANPLHENKVIVDFQQPVIDTELTMEADIINNHKTFKQLAHPKHRIHHKQTGADGEEVNESFAQNESGVLDILMVIDNSRSMGRVQKNMASRLSSLLGFLADSNWQIAITSTDTRDCIKGIISKDMQDYDSIYHDTIKDLGIDGSMFEEAIVMASRSLQGQCKDTTTPWLRDDASLAVIIVTDEDHQCYAWKKDQPLPTGKKRHEFCYKENDSQTVKLEKLYRSMDDLYSYLRDIRVPRVTAKIYGILNPLDRDHDANPTSGSKIFKSWREKIDGRRIGVPFFDKIASIKATDYSSLLQSISEDISVILKNQFSLKQVPDRGSLTVTIRAGGKSTTLPSSAYSVVGKTLTLNQAPVEGSIIDVNYTHARRPYLKEFAIPHTIIADSLAVSYTIDGRVTTVDPSDYSYRANKLTFAVPPPAGANIQIDYKEKTALKRTFQLSSKGKISDIEVKIGGKRVQGYRVTSRNTLVFDAYAIPAEKSVIDVFYRTVLKNILNYEIDLHPRLQANGLSCLTSAGEYLDCEYRRYGQKDMVSFAADDFVAGRLVTVKQELDVKTNDIVLHEDHIPASVALRIGAEVCDATDLTIINNTVILHTEEALFGCPVLRRSSGSIELTYKHREELQQFTIEESFFTSHLYEYAYWEVFVNGEKLSDEEFRVNSRVVTFPNILPGDAQVKIKVSLY